MYPIFLLWCKYNDLGFIMCHFICGDDLHIMWKHTFSCVFMQSNINFYCSADIFYHEFWLQLEQGIWNIACYCKHKIGINKAS